MKTSALNLLGVLFAGVVVFLFQVQPAHAHILVDSGGLGAGLSHPVRGFDHLLAMISVGILSVQMGGRAMGLVPVTFVFVMAVGGVLGILGIGLPGVEYGIALSVLVLGMALAIEKKLSVAWTLVVVGIFAVFHGHAHGVEMPSLATPVLYAIGLIVGTAWIHLAGVAIGLVFTRSELGSTCLRFAGAGMAVVGIFLLVDYGVVL